MDILLIGKKN